MTGQNVYDYLGHFQLTNTLQYTVCSTLIHTCLLLLVICYTFQNLQFLNIALVVLLI